MLRSLLLTKKQGLGTLAFIGWWLAPCCAQGVYDSFAEVKNALVGSEYRLYDRKGELIHEQRADFNHRHLGWVPLKDISEALKVAVVTSEDKRFFSHRGVDWIALVTAAVSYPLHPWLGPRRGASTISMQVASLLDKTLKARHRKRTWKQKIRQIQKALELEQTWSKDQIFETYLNLLSFRGELEGIASASRGLFQKQPNGLNQNEASLLAVLIRSPAASPERVLQRACSLLKKLTPHSNCSSLQTLVKTSELSAHFFPAAVTLAPHVAHRLRGDRPQRCTLDRKIQIQVLESLRRQVNAFRYANMHDAAALVVENATGRVLAYVGSLGSLCSAGSVDGVRARRQAGSTLKPFIYGIALGETFLTASSQIEDSATYIPLGPGSVYCPRNFDRQYHGSNITLRKALASSLNIPAVKVLQMIGVGRFVQKLKAMHFRDLKSEEFYGPSLALGSADVSLWELVNAYRTLANQGQYKEMTLLPNSTAQPQKKPSAQIFSPEVSFILGDILSDKLGRSLTFGFDSPMSARFWTAVKTGTSQDMRDNWCIGYSSTYTVGVWTGNFSGKAMWNVTGVTGAAPAWAEIMATLHQSLGAKEGLPPKPPKGLISQDGEWYVQGTQPAAFLFKQHKTPMAPCKIVYPVEGLMIAHDPDIPAELERVFFQASWYDPTHRWILNDQHLADADTQYAWKPQSPREYRLELRSAAGTPLDKVTFSVR